jgi:hypothetical protein
MWPASSARCEHRGHEREIAADDQHAVGSTQPATAYAHANVTAVRPEVPGGDEVACPDGAPSPTRIPGSSKPTVTFRALLLRAMLSVAAPLPRAARYSAATALGRLVTPARTRPPMTISATW